MAEFDDKLNSLLSNPDAMRQIMQLAQSLSGDDRNKPPESSPPPEAPGGDLFSALSGGLDPALLMKLLPLAKELGGGQDSNARQLLYALRPYLKAEKQEKLERALQLARLYRVGKRFLSEWEG